MFRPAFYLLITFGWFIFSCQNNTRPSPDYAPHLARQDTALIEPDAADLLQTLQGKWQSEQDSTNLIEITGEKMTHYNSGQVSLESVIEIDGNCLTNACKADSLDTPSGWCFIEKGQYDAQCNLVLKCDKQTLQYRPLGAANPALRFKKTGD